MVSVLLSQKEAGELVGKTPAAISHWIRVGSASAGTLPALDIREVEKDPAAFDLNEADVESFKLRNHAVVFVAVRRSDVLDYAGRVAGKGYPAGRPRGARPARSRSSSF